MALSTHSKFYYGLKITTQNRFLDFQEGANILLATLAVGSYTGASLSIEIKKKMEATGDNVYTVAYNRANRRFTISSTVNFSLLTLTGVNSGLSVFTLLGHNLVSDKTGFSTYLSDFSTGKEYKTQFHIQSHKPTSTNRKALDGVINKSASGVVEVVKFGNERFLSGELLFITNISQGVGSIIRTNTNGVSDYISFIEWCTDKGVLEFMVDENNVANYETFILETTDQDSKGLDYELIELYDRGLPEYFRSGILKFKLLGV